MEKAAKKRAPLFFFLKIALAAAVVWILFSRGQQEILKCLRSFDYRFLVPALFFQITAVLFSAWRWQTLAGVIQVKLTFFEALSLTMQGNFFSLVIPGGAIGGDVVKMAVISKRSKSGSRMEGVFTVFMDRVTGMISLFALTLLLLVPGAGVLMKLHFGSLPCDPRMNMLLAAGIALLCLAGLGASCAIFFHEKIFRLPGISFLIEKAELFSKGAVSRMTGATDMYARYWKQLAFLVLLTTFFVHLMAAVPMAFLFAGAGVDVAPFTLVFAVVIGNIAGLIPLFPGGIGIRDLVTVTILSAGMVNAGDAKTAQLLSTALMLLLNLAGGIFFILDPGRGKKELKREQQ